MKSNTYGLSRQILILKMLVASVVMLILAAGCTSSPSVTPENFALNFIQKRIPMIDLSVANLYVKEEQSGVNDRVQEYIALNKEMGTFESLSAETYDFSKIKVNMLDQKEEYIDDEAVNFVKVKVTGNYTKTTNGKTETLIEDEIVIMESIAGTWKVTEKMDPWKS